ncbi:MAG: indole-3-glycerol-phosphate synthase TrpC, partial [Gemmatimonadetes bacterium]|nr:indole-3-glycerol-phosphate synthase TrpC [Gemmatimonadota bacterium]NIS02388.1 indole-3-glycerol-phosphate synthase TrpC [Gemmatimonadota bacterium]NIT68290.1 indole-3-glycerol-phosphate synthase TrpC [Gemmatimonadota bacterium]NIU54701.1 indole-3-glycerol-phosphate synthase TrpC [Gemmatimonadota bacterium]NIV24864.1 indole-3-glycerol-phosphate synthase TrpC [Gemmatimonadota bacterium]
MAGDHLEPILARKRGEVADLARRAADLRAAAADMPPPRDWTGALRRPGEV